MVAVCGWAALCSLPLHSLPVAVLITLQDNFSPSKGGKLM